MAALIAWMLVVRFDNFVKGSASRRRLRRSTTLDEIINANRVPSMRSRPLSRPFNMLLLRGKPLPHGRRSAI
jgi:hypothetical protein